MNRICCDSAAIRSWKLGSCTSSFFFYNILSIFSKIGLPVLDSNNIKSSHHKTEKLFWYYSLVSIRLVNNVFYNCLNQTHIRLIVCFKRIVYPVVCFSLVKYPVQLFLVRESARRSVEWLNVGSLSALGLYFNYSRIIYWLQQRIEWAEETLEFGFTKSIVSTDPLTWNEAMDLVLLIEQNYVTLELSSVLEHILNRSRTYTSTCSRIAFLNVHKPSSVSKMCKTSRFIADLQTHIAFNNIEYYLLDFNRDNICATHVLHCQCYHGQHQQKRAEPQLAFSHQHWTP